jgi:hypothetical protein
VKSSRAIVQSCQPLYWFRQTATTSRPVAIRAIRTAAAQASLPVFTNRTCSAQGIASTRRSATSASSFVGSDSSAPCSDAVDRGGVDDRMPVPERDGAVPVEPVDVAVSVDALDVGAVALLEEQRERAERPDAPGRLAARLRGAGDDLQRALVELHRLRGRSSMRPLPRQQDAPAAALDDLAIDASQGQPK